MKRFYLITFLITLLLISGCTGSAKQLKKTNNFGINSAKKGYWNEAKFRWECILEKHPDDYVAMNNLAVCYEREGNFDKAIELYMVAIELAPKNKYIKINLQRAELVRANLDFKTKPGEEK
ncbi:MAG TPA: tetratricopeptide repeat protein [Firmicutes bacterium]|nr:tetratricopeptide repeat protein [Bacillota bacterium]